MKLMTTANDSVDGVMQVHGSGNLVRWLLDNHLVDHRPQYASATAD